MVHKHDTMSDEVIAGSAVKGDQADEKVQQE